eukprot:gene12360-8487_t
MITHTAARYGSARTAMRSALQQSRGAAPWRDRSKGGVGGSGYFLPLRLGPWSRVRGGPSQEAAMRTTRRQHASHSHSHSHGSGGHSHSHGSLSTEQLDARSLRQCKIVTAAGASTNVFFSITKLWAGSAGGSVALVADGFHALTDIVADAVSYFTVSSSRRRLPRCKFPFGVGRLETCGTVLVAGVLFIGSFLLLWQSCRSCVHEARRVLHKWQGEGANAEAAVPEAHAHAHAHGGVSGHHHSHFTLTEMDPATGESQTVWLMVILAASSVVCKELLFRWSRRVGLRAGSRVVVANAYHHRADAWSGAVALVGVGGQYFGIPGVDGLAGLVVSLYMCQIGFVLTKEAVLEFFDYQRAHEVRDVRRALQQFHLQVVAPACVTLAPAQQQQQQQQQPPLNQSKTDSTLLVSSLSHKAFALERVRFMNVFLLRHGHAYAAHVTMLACDSLHSKDIAAVSDRVAALASNRLSAEAEATGAVVPLRIEDTFITLLICSREEVVTRADYLRSQQQQSKENAALGRVGSRDADRDERGGSLAGGNGQPETTTAVRTPPRVAACGDLVNPSLEKCVEALERFHDFPGPLRYSWEAKEVYLPCCAAARSAVEHQQRRSFWAWVSAMPKSSCCGCEEGEKAASSSSSSSLSSALRWVVRQGYEMAIRWILRPIGGAPATDGAESGIPHECLADVESVAAMFRFQVLHKAPPPP